MKILIMSSSFTVYEIDKDGNSKARIIDNINGFRDNLQNYLTKRDLMLVISGNPKKVRHNDPLDITREGFKLSGIPFKEYIYIDDTNKHLIKDYIKRADCIQLHGGHLPRCNAFIEELGLRELIKDFNGVILGASGGAMNLADDVYCIPEEDGEAIDKNFKRHLRGCALTDINIIPHFDLFRKMQKDGLNMLNDILLPDSKDTPLLAIPDGSYVIQTDTDKTLYGEAYLLKDGQIKQICEKDKKMEMNKENYYEL